MAICVDGTYRGGQDPPLAATHVLMTRFNLAIPFSTNRFSGRQSLQGGEGYGSWLAGRVQLFETFCLPSVLNQAKRPDLWLLGLARRGTAELDPLLAAIRDHSWIVPVWQRRDGGTDERANRLFRRALRGRLDPLATHVVSTRLDSDDALGSNFIAYLDRYAAAVVRRQPDLDDFWISFPTGLQYAGGQARLFNCPDNHFLSRVRRASPDGSASRSTPYDVRHRELFRSAVVFLPVTEEPMWIEHVHAGNVKNHLRHRLPLLASPATLLAASGINVGRTEQLRRRLSALVPTALRTVRSAAKKRLRAAGLLRSKRRKKA